MAEFKRYTERDEYGNADIIGVDSADLQGNLDFEEINAVTDALNRLAAYEEYELEPSEVERYLLAYAALLKHCKKIEDLNEIYKFELAKYHDEGKAGLLKKLACKVGDMVKATVLRPYNGHEVTIRGIVTAINMADKIIIQVLYDSCRTINFYDTDFGKTIFLTHEEAVNALEGEKVVSL